MHKAFLLQAAAHLTNLAASLDEEILVNIAHRAFQSETIWFTGIGKSSYLAMKQAATCQSIQVNGRYIDAITALHGDLGVMKPGDTLFAISKSGLSTELKPLIVFATQNNIKVYLITMGADFEKVSKMYDKVNDNLEIANIDINAEELDGYGIIPSMSNAIFEMFLSTIVMHFPIEEVDLLKRLQGAHPGGSLQTKVTELLYDIENSTICNASCEKACDETCEERYDESGRCDEKLC